MVASDSDIAGRVESGETPRDSAAGFLDGVAHDLRTPLAVIKGLAESLADELVGPVNDEQRTYLFTIVDRCRDLARLIDDALDTENVRTARVRLVRRPHDVAELIESLRAAFELKARLHQVTLRCDVSADLPPIYVDGEMIGRVLVNLGDNAINHAGSGGEVVIRARECADQRIAIAVTANAVMGRHRPRHLACDGLAIAPQLVDLNLGDFSALTEPGQGSGFVITLPSDDLATVVISARAKAHDRAATAFPKIALLSAAFEGDEPNRADVLHAFLSEHCDAADVVLPIEGEIVHALGASAPPSEWIERLLRAWPTWAHAIGLEGDLLLRIERMSRPDAPELVSAVRRALQLAEKDKPMIGARRATSRVEADTCRSACKERTVTGGAQKTPHRERILIVDDDDEIIRKLACAIESRGFDVQSASTGAGGLIAFECGSVDLVITDLRMPAGDGIALVRRIREKSDAPIIVLTGFGDRLGSHVGSVANVTVVRKPVETSELMNLIEAKLESSEACAQR